MDKSNIIQSSTYKAQMALWSVEMNSTPLIEPPSRKYFI